jgi:hypothetical protein
MDSAARHPASVALAVVLGLRDHTQTVVAAYESGLVVPGRDRG